MLLLVLPTVVPLAPAARCHWSPAQHQVAQVESCRLQLVQPWQEALGPCAWRSAQVQQAMVEMFLLWLAMLPPAPLAVGLSFLPAVAKALVAVCL